MIQNEKLVVLRIFVINLNLSPFKFKKKVNKSHHVHFGLVLYFSWHHRTNIITESINFSRGLSKHDYSICIDVFVLTLFRCNAYVVDETGKTVTVQGRFDLQVTSGKRASVININNYNYPLQSYETIFVKKNIGLIKSSWLSIVFIGWSAENSPPSK